MKTKLVLFFLAAGFAAHAQPEKIDGFAAYFKVGVNAANVVSWDDGEPTETLAGASGGLGVYIAVGETRRNSRALILEGNFSGQGFKVEEGGVEQRVRTSYFNASAMLRQYFGHPYLMLGVERGWLTAAKVKTDDDEQDFTEGIHRNGVWNGIVGLGVNFGPENGRRVDFGLEASYHHGLSPLRNDFVKARHSVFNVGLFIPVAFVGELFAAVGGGY